MLDEILEYQQYSFNTDNVAEHVKRLKHKTLITSNFSGITRTLTIVARFFYFKFYESDEHWKEKTKQAMAIWLGFKADEIPEETKEVQRWLPQYVEKVLLKAKMEELAMWLDQSKLNDEEKEEIKALMGKVSESPRQRSKIQAAGELCEKCESYGFVPQNKLVHKAIWNIEQFLLSLSRKKAHFEESTYNDVGENDLYTLTYDSVLGNALRRGALKRYYLACDHLITEKITKARGRSRLADNDYDIIMKMTACCMLELSRKGASQSIFVHVNKSDFNNWLVKDKCSSQDLLQYNYNKKPLFEERLVGNNIIQVRLNQQWMDDCGFEILQETQGTDVIQDYLKEHPEGSVFVDKGGGFCMEEVKKTV